MNLKSKRILSLALEALYIEQEKISLEIASIESRLGAIKASTRSLLSKRRRKLGTARRNAISEGMKRHWIARRASKNKQKSRAA